MTREREENSEYPDQPEPTPRELARARRVLLILYVVTFTGIALPLVLYFIIQRS